LIFNYFFFNIEYHEVLEELLIKKQFLDDDSHLHTPPAKRISMMHHIPINESLVQEDLKVNIPGGITEEISIRTDFAPPTQQLSFTDQQLTPLPVIFFFCFV
jgi:hypothetical protein